jgi:hypothetical protein
MDWGWDRDWPVDRLPLPPSKGDLVPVEILSEIFLLIVQDDPGHRRNLVLVCQYWHAIILSTPGIHSQLTIRRATQGEAVQAFIQGRKSRLHVRVDMNDEQDGSDFNAENFHACFTAAAQSASRWSSLTLISPPPYGEYKAMQILQPLVHLESLKLACGFDEFLEPLMITISKNASPNLSTMTFKDPVALLYLVEPAWLPITHSLTSLTIQLSKRMDSPVDILPHLYRLKEFEARNLCLPFYPPDASLPLIHTLRFLYLKSVSVQWMAGHVFPALEQCEVKFPHHADIIQGLRPVSMPSCSHLLYYSNDLHALAQFHLPSLNKLDVKSGQWNVWRGNPQLAVLCPVFTARAKSLTELRLDVECSEQLLVYILRLIPALELLWLELAHPNALSTTFFRAFIIREPNSDDVCNMVGPLNQTIAPLCPSLRSLYLHYRRWLRGPDKKALIAAFGDIMTSRNLDIHSSFNLWLSFDEALSVDEALKSSWLIDDPVRRSQHSGPVGLMLGILVPRAIISISTLLPPNGLVPLPFKEVEYLRLCSLDLHTSFEFLFTHDHMELMIHDYHRPPRPTSLPRALPLFYALRVLVVEETNPSFLAGHTFYKLERFRVVKWRYSFGALPSLFTETEMPVCTRVDMDDPSVLAAIKLPQIHELALNFFYPECNTIWEKHIAVNANLSGLTLLHMKNWRHDNDLIPILGSLPLLETLIICSWLGIISFKPFLPIATNGTSGLKKMSGEGETLALLCPRLQRLQIDVEDSLEQLEGSPPVEPELIPILKDIVTHRAEFGSPLKSFTFSKVPPKPRSKFELIGTDGSFTMEKIVLAEAAEEFRLDI